MRANSRLGQRAKGNTGRGGAAQGASTGKGSFCRRVKFLTPTETFYNILFYWLSNAVEGRAGCLKTTDPLCQHPLLLTPSPLPYARCRSQMSRPQNVELKNVLKLGCSIFYVANIRSSASPTFLLPTATCSSIADDANTH